MPLYGEIIVIKRDGTDGTHFPLTANSCLFGRKRECDIRIQLPQVFKEHCKIEVNENKEVIFFNLSSVTPAQVNGNNITDPTYLKHGDVLTIIDRSFRFEYPPVSFPQKRRSRSQEKDTLQVLHVQQDLSQNSKTGTPQISDKELEQKNQTPNGNKKGQSQESVTTRNDASESAYKIHQSERKNEISFSSEFSVPVKYEDATKGTEENRELRSQDNSPRKDDNMSEDISQMSNRRSANLRSTDTVTQKGVSHAGGTKNQDINSVVPHPDENSCRKPSRRSSATQSSTSLQNYVTKQKDHEDPTPLKFQHTAENEPEKSKEIKGASNDYIFSASRPGTNFIPELCCIVSLDYTDETSHSQKSIDKIHEVGTAEIMPNLKDSFGSDGSFLSTPASNQKHFQENSSPFTGNTRKCFLKYSILPTELDSLNEMKYAETSFETEECSLDTSTGEYEKNDMSGNKYPKRRRSSKKMATEVMQTPKEQRNEMAVNCTLKDGNSGTIASSLHCSNSKSPRRSFKQNSSVNTGTMMKISTEELFIITTGSEMGRRTGQLSDDNFGRNYHEENAEKIKQPIPDVHEENTNMKNNMPVFSSLYESDVQTPVEAVSEMNMRDPCRSNKKPEIKKSPQKRKNTDPETLFQPLGKRKRVSFGGQLSPELFDKRLPPNSPLKKGAIPARLSLPFGNSPRAVLKKASGLRQSTIKGFSEREQGNNILNEKATSPPVRKSPAASGPSRRSPAASSPPSQRSPATASPPTRRSPATASPPARKSPAGSPPARRSPAASSAASPPARRSPATASPPARRAPARKSPVGSPPARRSPAASSAASPPARRSPATASPPTRRSPATASPSARKSPAGSPPARRSPAASSATSPLARRSPTASPPTRRSPAGSLRTRRSPATSPRACFSCNTPQRKGRFSISYVTCPSPKEQSSVAIQIDENKEITQLKTSEPTEQESKASGAVRRSKNFASRINSLHRRSAVGAIQSKRRSGASEANLIVAKSWADVVKQGVPKSQLRTTTTKCGRKRSTAKKPTKPSKNHDSILKTPVRKFTGHFTTGHANSPAPIVVGKAHISTVNLAAQVPKVMYNYPLKQHSDLNESFTGMAEMFSTPPNREQEESLSYGDRKMSKQEAASEIHTETEAEESPTPSCIVSNQQQHYKEDAISSQDSTLGQDDLQITPRGTYGAFSETVTKDSIMEGVHHTAVTGMQDKTQEKKSETVKVLSGTKRLLKTPKPKPEPVEAMSGDKRILRTPKQKPEPMESFSGVTSLLRTPNQSQESVQALPGVTRILRTPKQKPESVEALSAVRRFVKTPKQKPEPVESLSGVKRLLRTPKQKTGTVEVLSGIKRLLKTPRQKTEPVEALSGVRRLLRTPKQKMEPVEALSGMKDLLRTPKENLAPVADEVCSKLMKSPEEMAKELMGSDTEGKVKQMQLGIDCLVEEPEKIVDIDCLVEEPEKRVGIDCLVEEPEKRVSPMDDFKGIQRLFRTPKQKNKPLEDLAGLSRLLKTPKQRFLPVDDYLGLQKFMTEPKQNCLTPEIDYLGIKEMLETPDEQTELPELANSIAGGNESNINSKNGNESMGNESASKEAKLGRYVLIQRSDDKHDLKLEDTTGHAFSNPFNELKTEADREMIEGKCETSKVKQILSCYSEETNSQIGAIIDFVKEPTAELGQIDKEVVEVLASHRRTRRGKANESNFMKENAMQIQRYTRNSYKALSTNAIENCTDLGLMQESNNSALAVETVKKSLRGTSRKHFTATVESVMSNNISHAPELLKPSKEPSDKMQPYLRRKRAAKPKEPETILGLKEKADAKIPLRNKEDSKSDLKSQFAEENTQDKMQNENFGNLGMENNGNILKRSRRGRNITEQTDIEILNAAVEEDKTGRKKCTASKSYKKRLENNTGEVKENAVTHLLKGKKVHFLLEKNDALLLQEKSALGEKGDSRKESNASSTTEQTSRRSKRKISVAPQPVGFSPSKEKQALEINETQYKQDTFFSSENVIAGSDRSGVSFRLGHEECGEKGQNGESPDESQKVQLESVQTPAGRSRPRRQKVEKENIHQRGRGKQAICKEIPTQDSNKKADNMKKHTKKNQTKRGKGRKIDLQLEIPLPLEQNTLERENPKVDNLNSAQSECSEQYIQNEPHPNDTQNITLGSAPVTAQCDSQKRDEVGKENALRRSKRKVLAHEITENVSQQDVGTVEQNMDIRNKNLPKRTKGRRIVSEFQTLLSRGVSAKEDLEVGKSSSAQEDCSLQQPQNAINPNETQNMPMESVQVLAEQSLPDGLNVPRKGRRKAIVQTTLTEYNSKQAGSTTEEDVVVKSACSSKENQSKRSRTRKIVPASQALISPIQNNVPLQALTQSKNAEQSSDTSETKTTANENRPHRSRRRKADDIITTGSVSASKKPKLPDKSNQEKMPRDIQDVSKESISKRSGRKQLVLQKTLAECNGQLGNNSEKAMPVKDESVPLKKGSGKAKKTKKNKGEQIALESQVSSSLNVSITVPPLSSEKGGTACKNPSTVIENGAVGKARQAKCSRRNKTVVSTTAVRRKYKQTAEEVDHENNLEKTDVANQKQCRSDRRKLVALEATICASVKEKYGLNTSSDTAPNDLLEILDNNAAKKNPPRRGKRRQVNSDSETSASTSITTRDVILENKLKSKAEDSEKTTLQKGKRKMKEEPTRAEETEGRTRGSKRTKK